MSESWKEKAKTDDLEIAVQLERILRQHSVEDADAFDRFYERLKIAESKLEDAQKEIDFQKARVDVANEMVASKQKRIDAVKQKLQPIFEHYKDRFINHVWMGYETGSVLNDFLLDWMDKILEFEELLKREAEW